VGAKPNYLLFAVNWVWRLCFLAMEKFDEMPDGWRIDKTWGSPEWGWTPISNGKSLLNGGRKGLLRVHPVAQPDKPAKVIPISRKEPLPKLSNDEISAISETTNQLARARFKEKLLQELLFDLTVCKIEGWDYKEYVAELKLLIDEACQKIGG
jgi:hypothetical protein